MRKREFNEFKYPMLKKKLDARIYGFFIFSVLVDDHGSFAYC